MSPAASPSARREASPGAAAPAVPSAAERRASIGAVIAGSAGNLIEWYDYYAYAFTAIYFSSSFFPKGDQTAQLLGTGGIFAVGFFFRPLGGWFFGRFADRQGRQAAMVVSILMMGVGSLLIALMPTYKQIGALAPVLLVLGRIVQGFSTGGQYGTAATYLSEVALPGRRGFYSSFQYVTLIGGQLCAVVLILVLQALLTKAQMQTFGWRIAFLVGALGALAILLFRGAMHETTSAKDRAADSGSLKALLRHPRGLLTVIGLTAGGSLSFYTFTTYMQKYLVNTAHMEPATANWVMTGVLVPFMALQPLLGWLSDRIGRRYNMIAFGVLSTLCTVPLLSVLAGARDPGLAFVLVLAGLAINSTYTSVAAIFKAELFPTHVRALGVSLAYGLANAIFGGTAEVVALSFKQAGHESRFYWYVTAVCFVSLLAALGLRDSRKHSLLPD